MLREIKKEDFEKKVSGESVWGPFKYADGILNGLKKYVRRTKMSCDYGTNAYSEYEIPSILGGKIYIIEVRDEKLAYSAGFQAKSVRVSFEYLEDAASEDLEQIRNVFRKYGLEKGVG